jgi:hypothetical protein
MESDHTVYEYGLQPRPTAFNLLYRLLLESAMLGSCVPFGL